MACPFWRPTVAKSKPSTTRKYTVAETAALMEMSEEEIRALIDSDPDFPKPDPEGFYDEKTVREHVGPLSSEPAPAIQAVAEEAKPAEVVSVTELTLKLPLVDRAMASVVHVRSVNRRPLSRHQTRVMARVLAGCVARGIKTNNGQPVTSPSELIDWLLEQVEGVA